MKPTFELVYYIIGFSELASNFSGKLAKVGWEKSKNKKYLWGEYKINTKLFLFLLGLLAATQKLFKRNKKSIYFIEDY